MRGYGISTRRLRHGHTDGRTAHAAAAAMAVAAVALRLAGAWAYRHDSNPDFGIVELMVKHMLEGHGVPVFFCGQAYMGTLEPLVSAGIAALAGFSGFAVCLGTVLTGLALLPVVYAWARELGGRTAGLAALAFCAIGPSPYFHYMVSPRGGYAMALLTGTAVLWLAGRMIRDDVDGRPAGPARFFGVGLIGGLGWWSSQLVTAALLTAAMAWAGACGRHLRPRTAGAGAAGFLAGTAPFWLWNLRHDWASFHYAASFPATNVARGFSLFFGRRMNGLLDLANAPRPVLWIVAAVLVLSLLVPAAARLAALRRAPRDWRATVPSLLPLLFVLVSAAVFAPSFFATLDTPRYLLPLVPALAVAAGQLTALLARTPVRHAPSLAWLPVAALVAHHASRLPTHIARAQQNDEFVQRADELARSMRANTAHCVYAPYSFHALNARLDEAFVFTDFRQQERYPPYAVAAEEDAAPAVMNDYGGFKAFLQSTDATCRYGGTRSMGLYLGAARAPRAWREVPPETIGAHADGEAAADGVLFDGSLDTSIGPGRGGRRTVELDLDAPRAVCGFRLLCRPGGYPDRVIVETRDATAGGWTTVSGAVDRTDFFWSGPRFYPLGSAYRYERRFAPRPAQALRITVEARDAEGTFAWGELQVFEMDGGGGGETPEADAVKALLDTLLERRVDALYADRWAAHRVFAATGGRIRTPREPRVYGLDEDGLPWQPLPGRTAWLLIRAEDAALCRRGLANAAAVAGETAVGPWVLMQTRIASPALRWCGVAMLRDAR